MSDFGQGVRLKNAYPNYLYRMKKQSLLLWFCFLAAISSDAQVGADTKTVYINPTKPPSPPEKAGYKLVVWDEFEESAVDTTRWCPWGDAWVDECDPRCFLINEPENVTVANGVCRLAISRASAGDCDAFSSEIKSFRYPANGFGSWYVEPYSYLEIRAKLPHGANTGSAGWLYFGWSEGNVYREIDIWETFHDDDTQYQINRHFGVPGAGEPFKVNVRDSQGGKVHMSQHFLTFGMLWEPNNVGFYLNGQFVAEYCCFEPDRQFNWPMSMRLSAGNASLSGVCPDLEGLPKTMEVDYVRYYVRDTTDALYLVKITDSIQVNAEGKPVVCCPSIWVNYIPDVTYEVFSPAASLELWPGVPGAAVWGITPLPDLPLDSFYPVSVVAHFREPHVRSDTLNASFFLTDKPDVAPLIPNRIVPQPLLPAKVYPTFIRAGEVLRVENPFHYTLLQIVTTDGRIMHETFMPEYDDSVTLPPGLSPGIYFVKLHSDCALRTAKIFVSRS